MASVNKMYPYDNMDDLRSVNKVVSIHARKATYGDVREDNLHHFTAEKNGVQWTFLS